MPGIASPRPIFEKTTRAGWGERSWPKKGCRSIAQSLPNSRSGIERSSTGALLQEEMFYLVFPEDDHEISNIIFEKIWDNRGSIPAVWGGVGCGATCPLAAAIPIVSPLKKGAQNVPHPDTTTTRWCIHVRTYVRTPFFVCYTTPLSAQPKTCKMPKASTSTDLSTPLIQILPPSVDAAIVALCAALDAAHMEADDSFVAHVDSQLRSSRRSS